MLELIEQYRPGIEQRHQSKLVTSLGFDYSPDWCTVQAEATIRDDGIVGILTFPGLLTLPIEAVVFVICHEIGHLMGDVPFSTTAQTNQIHHPKLAVEGEADYFGGACARKAMCPESKEFCEKAVDGARLNFEEMFGKGKFDAEIAEYTEYKKGNGINHTYPDPNCRMLSALNGVLGLERPKCWYNPTADNL